MTGLQIDEHIARIALNQGAAPQVKTYLTDALGSVMATAKADQSLEVGYAYSPYGQTQKAGVEGQVAGSENTSQYTGRENDQNGLYYYRARYYDPVLKRFISEDPIGLDGGINSFSYVGGDPVSFIDPTGEIAWGLAFGGADLAWQLYQNGGNLRCVNWTDVGLSALGGGLLNVLGKGAFRFKKGAEWVTKSGKVRNPHSWGATSKWMNKEGIQVLKPGQHRHHWLFERNQGFGKNLPEWLKNQPWNTNPISQEFNVWLGSRPALAPLGAPSWVPEIIGGGATAVMGDGCECP